MSNLYPSMSRKLDQRRFPEVPWSRTRLHPIRELVPQSARRLGLTRLVRHEVGIASVDAVYGSLDRSVASDLRRNPRGIQAIYAYEDGALNSFLAAKDLGIKCLYDLPIAHWRTLKTLLSEEAQRWPDWAVTMEGLTDSASKHERKDEEITLADNILVASSFTRNSLLAHFGTELPITTIPYGCPPPLVKEPRKRKIGEPLHLFYAGHLSQRKGVADLIAALHLVDVDWRITLAGPLPTSLPVTLAKFLDDRRCHWLGTIPHPELLAAMTDAHAFVFPSIVEGFGMVITEAMASGLPVITTPNTCGPDILIEGYDGYIVPIQSPETIAERISTLANNETLRFDMATNALSTATRSAWSIYEGGVLQTVASSLTR